MTVIILINWNGANDTIACLRSLAGAEGDFRVVVGDNGSEDDSVERIRTFLASDEWTQTSSHAAEVLPLEHNWGFAVGNNKVIAYARRYQPDSYMLLNNDTEVEPDFMLRLQEYRLAHPDVKVVGPLICYWTEKDRIWSCGGRLTFGTRKGYYRDWRLLPSDCQPAEGTQAIADRSPLPVTFMSGCGLLADASLLDNEGRLLTERFFFGEEDYEFAHRMRRAGEKMAIVRESVIYHKVASAARRMAAGRLGRDYMYYLGRLIVARLYYNPLQFWVIRLLSVRGCYKYFKADGLSSREAFRLVRRLMHDARTKEGISYDDFLSYNQWNKKLNSKS
jgi:hypothetical protein